MEIVGALLYIVGYFVIFPWLAIRSANKHKIFTYSLSWWFMVLFVPFGWIWALNRFPTYRKVR